MPCERPDLVPEGAELVLEVTASGVCHTDVHFREGGFDLGNGERMSYADRNISLPVTPGHEIAGTIVAAGPDCSLSPSGKQYTVFPWCGCGTCELCAAGQEQLCSKPGFLGFYRDGGFASHVLVPDERYLFETGDLEPGFAATLACSGLTVFSALKKAERDLAGQPPLIIGAGGLGLMAIQLIRAMGAPQPVVVDIDPVKREAALAAGAKAAVDPAAKDASKQIRSACGGAPRAVFDFVGSEKTAGLGFNAVARGGSLVIVGLYGGAAAWPLPFLVSKSVAIHGSYTGSLPEFAALMELAREGRIKPIPMQDYALHQANQALDLLEKGDVVGRAILRRAVT